MPATAPADGGATFWQGAPVSKSRITLLNEAHSSSCCLPPSVSCALEPPVATCANPTMQSAQLRPWSWKSAQLCRPLRLPLRAAHALCCDPRRPVAVSQRTFATATAWHPPLRRAPPRLGRHRRAVSDRGAAATQSRPRAANKAATPDSQQRGWLLAALLPSPLFVIGTHPVSRWKLNKFPYQKRNFKRREFQIARGWRRGADVRCGGQADTAGRASGAASDRRRATAEGRPRRGVFGDLSGQTGPTRQRLRWGGGVGGCGGGCGCGGEGILVVVAAVAVAVVVEGAEAQAKRALCKVPPLGRAKPIPRSPHATLPPPNTHRPKTAALPIEASVPRPVDGAARRHGRPCALAPAPAAAV